MLKFAAEDFWRASQILAKWREGGLDLTEHKESTSQVLGELMEHLVTLDLGVSVKEFQKLAERSDASVEHCKSLDDAPAKKAALEKTIRETGVDLEYFSSVVHSELDSRLFFHVTQDESKYYDRLELFGSRVNRAFPTIQFDMVEAGNCYAFGRATACVFHLMRIMEVGVQRLGDKLGVKLTDEKNWQNILDEVNKAIKRLPPKDAATVAMSRAAANLYSVKLGWRNEVMHPGDKYTPEEAEHLIRMVKQFMAQLAEIVQTDGVIDPSTEA